ncbi:MAG: hypothetical protein J1E85_08910, partial [Ruminococcus sp.]|nr:hypothetical protein [Ruminococcus sp.]
SLVECLVWDQDAAGSSPVTSTKFRQFLTACFFVQRESTVVLNCPQIKLEKVSDNFLYKLKIM